MTPSESRVTPAELREIVKDAYIYGFPMVDSYRIQYSYFVDRTHPEFKGAWNEPRNVSGVYTPQDKAMQTPNSDTPYSFLGADLRTEPLVVSVPAIPRERYYSLQFIDMYTHNFAYVRSRATGSDAGNYLLAGPEWHGAVPDGIKSVIRSETDFAFVLYRTQLFGTSDLENVKKFQGLYTVRPLSRFTGTAPPPPAASVNFVRPLTPEAQKTSPEFFSILNFLLRFASTHRSEVALMKRFAKAGIGPGLSFDVAALSPDQRQAVTEGMADAWASFAKFKKEEVDTGKKSSGDGFGTREFLHNDYMNRMSSAVLVINSRMEPDLIRDADGGITLHIQHDSPGKDKEPNWLPAPKGPFFMVLREYWPKPEAFDGSWKAPQAVRAPLRDIVTQA